MLHSVYYLEKLGKAKKTKQLSPRIIKKKESIAIIMSVIVNDSEAEWHFFVNLLQS